MDIDSNENSRRYAEAGTDRRKVSTNNNNNSPVFLSAASSPCNTGTTTSTTTTSSPKNVPCCLAAVNGQLNCVNGGGAEQHDGSPRSESTESLPFHNEGLIEEIYLLPNNVISDDEASSQSDNCVYAYRGANAGSPELPQQAPCADDETDFLEMDFEPEPNSEVENYIDEPFNHLEANFFSLQQNLSHFHHDNGIGCSSPEAAATAAPLMPLIPPQPIKETGAKPKQRLGSSSSSSRSPYETTRSADQMLSLAPPLLVDSTSPPEELPCLECAEADFLHQTKPELAFESRCSSHRLQNHVRVTPNRLQQATPPTLPPPPPPPNHKIEHPLSRQLLSADEPQSKSSAREFMVTIYSVGSDYETIVEAINSIGVAVNIELIRQYFDAQIDEETATMSVPEYLLFVSKKSCNYKKLMEMIRMACLEPIDIHFYPADPLAQSPELVQIQATEITNRWNPNTDLRQILRFKNRHFRFMNILGGS